jgi:23S rRNA (uracil1939-C5)-methyltransferase
VVRVRPYPQAAYCNDDSVKAPETTEATPKRERPHRGQELELEISSLAFGGRGVARTPGGYVVFVAGALPGDKVRAEVTKPKRSFAEARAVEILSPGAERVPDRCDHGGEPCPGSPWQGLAYERQLEEKQGQVADALGRIGHLEGFDLEPIEPAVEQWRYRNKLEYSFGERDGRVSLGFHARGRWDETVDAEDCHLASEANNAARNAVRAWARGADIAAYDRRAETGVLRNLIVREGRRTGEMQTRLVTSASTIPKPPVDLHTIIEGPSGDTGGGTTGVLGQEVLHETLCGLDFEISHRAFFQTNTEMAEVLYGIAAEFAGLEGTERVFDLYCGIGTLGLSLARNAGEVWGMEIVEEAIEDAAHGDPPAGRGGRKARPRRARPAPRRPLREDRPPRDRDRGAAHRLRLLQPHDAGAERRPARRGRI